ncbi:GNAT family N-acetyltransferase [Thermosynechococcaceae cyanobacterium Okahandja]
MSVAMIEEKNTLNTDRPNPIEGTRLRLRPVDLKDANYIYSLRTDPRYNRYLSPVSGTVDNQRHWIEQYFERERGGTEYYFVIERKDNNTPCGVVRIYDIRDSQFTWGSWILDENKPVKAALESALLVYDFGFQHLKKEKAVFDVRLDNEKVISFHAGFGAIETRRDDINAYFVLSKEMFQNTREKFARIVR